MSEYTKEQEAEALERAAQYSDMDSRPYWRVVLSMAKRTAEAEARADASEADAKRLADDWAAVLLERDALKARVAELERIANDWREERDIAERKLSAPKELPAPPVVVTRELLEMMLADAETRAVYGRGDVPLNPAARLVVAMNAVLEVKP